jgi:hypothetical protein
MKVAAGTPHSSTVQEVAFPIASCSFEMEWQVAVNIVLCCLLAEEFCADCSGILWPLWKLTVVYSICLHQNALTCSELKFFELEFH